MRLWPNGKRESVWNSCKGGENEDKKKKEAETH